MGMNETVLFAFSAFITAIFGFLALANKRRLLEAVFGLCTCVFSLLSAYNFRLALIDSGKNPEFLGFYRYPFVFPVYCLFVILGIALLVHGLVRIIKKHKEASR